MLERWRKRHLDSVGDYFSALEHAPTEPPQQVEKAYGDVQRNSNLRLVLSGGAPGMWASDHYQESLHCHGWNFAAAHTLALQFSMAQVNAYGRRVKKSQRDPQHRPRDPIDALKARLDGLTITRKSSQTEYETQDAQERIPLDHDHPLVSLMRRPNPDQSGTQFRYQMAQQLALTGGALVWCLRDKRTKYDRRGTVREMYIIPTGLAMPMPPSAQFPLGWYRVMPMATYGANLDPDGFAPGGTMGSLLVNGGQIDKREVRGLGWPHPLYVNDWLSTVSASALQTDTIEEMERAVVARFRNEGRPGLIFGWESVDIWAKVTDEEKTAFREDVRARNAGTHNTGQDLVKAPGMTVESFDSNPREMDFSGSIPLARNNLLAMHQTPQAVVGLNDATSYAALFAALKQYVELKVTPNLTMAFEEVGEEVCPAYGPGHSLEAKARSIDDPALHGQKMDRLQTRGLVTIDEARADEGKPPHPDPEYGKLPSGTTWQAWQQVKQAAEQAKQQAQQPPPGGPGGPPQPGQPGQGGQPGQPAEGGAPTGEADALAKILGDAAKPGDDKGTGTREESRDAPDGRSDAMGTKAAAIEDKSFDALVGKAIDSDQHKRASALWLLLQGKSEAAIVAAAQGFLNDYTAEFRTKLEAMLASGRGISQADVEALIDQQKLAAGYQAAVLPVMLVAAADGARFEWKQHAPPGADFDPVAKQAEDDARKRWFFTYWLLLASNLRQHLIQTGMQTVDEARLANARPARQIARDTITPPSAKTLGVTEGTATTGVGQDTARKALIPLGVFLLKRWTSMEDHKVRPTHRIAHGQTVAYDGKFIVGGYPADYPCDPSLPMHERAGCRCHALSIVIESQTRTKAWDGDEFDSLVELAVEYLAEKKFDPSEGRDESGKWTSGGGGHGDGKKPT